MMERLLKSKNHLKFGKFLLFMVVLIFALMVAVPLFIVFTTAFKADNELSKAAFAWLPKKWLLSNFTKAFTTGDWGRYFFNSFFVTAITVIGSIFFNSLAGYSLARLRFAGRNFILILFLVGIMVPPQSYIIPQFIFLRSIPLAGGNDIFGQGGTGWLNTYWALIVPFLSGSFGIFLCRQFYITFPKDLDDSAKIDGCNPFLIYVKIFLPLSGPILATLTILKSVATWNDFFYPLIMTNSDSMLTIQIALQKFRTTAGVQWNLLMAATVISLLPVIIVFLCAQRYFIRGIVTTGLKV